MTLASNDIPLDTEFADELETGTELMRGQYKIEKFLAAGGFGITYLARDSLDRRVVIKECFPGNFCRRQNHSVIPRSRSHHADLKSIVRLFSQEAKHLATAHHPNIVGVHQVFEENNTAYMALDYIEGRDLLDVMLDDPESLKPEVVETYLTKLLGAIGHIHGLGILHRDISPDNIIVNAAGEPILIDFGAAQQTGDPFQNEEVTRMLTAMHVVKDGYSPQELYVAGGEQTESCDLYSLAASFYHIIAGELPPNSQVRLGALAADEPDPYVSLAKKTGDYSATFIAALDQAMSVLPRERMQNADAWLARLEEGAQTETVTPAATPVAPVNSAQAPTQEKRPIVPLAAAAGLAASVGLAAVLLMAGDEAPSDTVAETSSTTASTALIASIAPAIAPEAAEVREPKLANVEEVVTSISQPPLPPKGETKITLLAAIFDARPSIKAQDDTGLRTAMLGHDDIQPDAETDPPAALPAPVLEEDVAEADESEEVGTAETFADGESALAFFIAMDKEQPELVSQPKVSAIPEVATDEAEEKSWVVTQSVPDLPFTLADWDPGLIANVDDAAPAWLAQNSRIISINGEPVASTTEIRERMNALAAVGEAETFDATLGIETEAAGTIEQTLTIAKERHILLQNGLRFIARLGNEGWTTEVLEAPGTSNFLPGDHLMFYVSTWESLDKPTSLQSILERELALGASSFGFSVSRDNEVWVETFELSAL